MVDSNFTLILKELFQLKIDFEEAAKKKVIFGCFASLRAHSLDINACLSWPPSCEMESLCNNYTYLACQLWLADIHCIFFQEVDLVSSGSLQL